MHAFPFFPKTPLTRQSTVQKHNRLSADVTEGKRGNTERDVSRRLAKQKVAVAAKLFNIKIRTVPVLVDIKKKFRKHCAQIVNAALSSCFVFG